MDGIFVAECVPSGAEGTAETQQLQFWRDHPTDGGEPGCRLRREFDPGPYF